MMMGEPVTRGSGPEGGLPPVPENEDHKSPTDSMGGLQMLTPPGTMRHVASTNSMKLMGVPVTDNDPLGALSNEPSPTSGGGANLIQKSATTTDLLTKQPNAEENILGKLEELSHTFEILSPALGGTIVHSKAWPKACVMIVSVCPQVTHIFEIISTTRGRGGIGINWPREWSASYRHFVKTYFSLKKVPLTFENGFSILFPKSNFPPEK